MSGMLQITEPVSADESIESFEYVEYTAAQSTNINASQGSISLLRGVMTIYVHGGVISRLRGS